MNPTDEIFQSWRMHTYPFTGNYVGSFIGHRENPLPYKQLVHYFTLTGGLPEWAIIKPPELCGEAGWKIDGGIVNLDILSNQFYLTSLYKQGILTKLRAMEKPAILEIGGGYGLTAWALQHAIPQAKVHLTDLTKSLYFGAVYLTLVDPDHQYSFIPNYKLEQSDQKFDLVTIGGAFGEMSAYQVERYRDIVSSHLKPNGIMYGSNGEENNPVREIMKKEFPYCLALDRTQRIWTKDKGVLDELKKIKASLPAMPSKIEIAKKILKYRYSKIESKTLFRDWRGMLRAGSAWYNLFRS